MANSSKILLPIEIKKEILWLMPSCPTKASCSHCGGCFSGVAGSRVCGARIKGV